MNLLTVDNITKRYANHTALNGVSIRVPEQSIFGLLGPNGAGKTSLIRIINMITAPDTGSITLKGEPLKPAHKEWIGYLPEERGLYKKMKVGEQAVYLARLKGLSNAEAVKRLREWFERFEILNWWNRKVEELSKGMQQKIQFVVTVLHNPRLLIFDEPFSGFDPINAGIIKEEIIRMRNNGATIIFSTHNMASVEELCDHIALINKSNKILEGSMTDIKNQYRSHTYRVVLENASEPVGRMAGPGYVVTDEKSENNKTIASIRITDGSGTNRMISSLLNFGELISVQEIIPTMNDIFISMVSNDGQYGTSNSLTE